MTKKETALMLMKIKGYYPSSLNGMSENETEWMVEVWAEIFEPYDVKHVKNALEYIVKHELKNFAPSIGAIVQRTEVEMERPVYTQEQIDRVKRIKAQ